MSSSFLSSGSSGRLTALTNPESRGDSQVAFTSGPNTSTISGFGVVSFIQVPSFTPAMPSRKADRGQEIETGHLRVPEEGEDEFGAKSPRVGKSRAM